MKRLPAIGLPWRATALAGTLTVSLTLAIVTAGAAHTFGARAAGAGPWTVEPTPNPPAADISGLASVSCPARRVCIAVGSSAVTLASPTLPLAERWNGTRWRMQSIPAPRGSSDTLYGISCPTTHRCFAVGSAYYLAGGRQSTLTEIWNGRRWRVQRAPMIRTGAAALHSVSCGSSDSCLAVGNTQASGGSQAIVERWNGTTWRRQAVPRAVRSTNLEGVSCSSAAACVAVGYGSRHPHALSWQGNTWRVRAMALPRGALEGELDGVSCSSPLACTATGTYVSRSDQGLALAERWNGRSWHAERTPKPPDWSASLSQIRLDGVACAAADACTAVGIYSPGHTEYFLEFWNGRSWQLQAAPHPADFGRGALFGIDCVRSSCSAVGAYSGGARLQVTLAILRGAHDAYRDSSIRRGRFGRW